MSNFWKSKKVLVTGGAGFIGSYVAEQLLHHAAIVSITTHSNNLTNISHIKKNIRIIRADLRNKSDAEQAVKDHTIVLHLASQVAGILFNKSHPASMFSDNVLMTQHILDACVKVGTDRILLTSSACVYPRGATVPTPEEEGFTHDPEPTNLGYGWGKRVIELMGKFYAMEYGLQVAIARPFNAYGPRDDFDTEKSHVIPGLIKRIYEGENPLIVWGSGNQTRSFIYAADVAQGMLAVTEKYPLAEAINLGAEDEITIGKLAALLIELSGKKVSIQFDTTKPDGQLRRSCDTTKAKNILAFQASTPLSVGLTNTLAWYEQHLLS